MVDSLTCNVTDVTILNFESEVLLMPDYPAPYLCGGTFFVLLLQARPQRGTAQEKLNSERDGLADTDVMTGLLDVVAPGRPTAYYNTYRKNVSEYKACKYNGGMYITFKDNAVKNDFDSVVKHDYQTALNRMKLFVSQFIGNQADRNQLVRALLDVIENDGSISENENFYIGSSGESKNKSAIRMMTDFEFEPFLIGVLHFVVCKREKNKNGRKTFEKWHKPVPNSEWEFNSDIGAGITRNIVVHSLVTPGTVLEKESTEVVPNPVFVPTGMVYYDPSDGLLHIGEDSVEILPEMLPPESIQPKEDRYVQSLLDAYNDDKPGQGYSRENIDSLPRKYKQNLREQRYNFYSAIRICKIAKRSIANGESEIRKWKTGTFDYISDTYYDDYDSGYRRLVSVMQKVVDTPTTASIDVFQNLIKSKEKKGVLHLLVDDGEMQWVLPDE